MSRQRGRMPKREADEIVSRTRDTRVILPTEMPLPAVVELPGMLLTAVRSALNQLQPYERTTTQVHTIAVHEGERFDNGNITYGFEVRYEHDCPNGACDDCIGDD